MWPVREINTGACLVRILFYLTLMPGEVRGDREENSR